MPPEQPFPRLVSLACHDLRTPLATIYGFARTLSRGGELDERSARFVGMIEQASEQMTELLDELGVAARIVADRWEPALRHVDTLALATVPDESVEARGSGETIETAADEVGRSLRALALAAVRHGGVDRVAWDVDGRTLVLSPVVEAARPVVGADDVRDLGALVAHLVIGGVGGRVELADSALRVTL